MILIDIQPTLPDAFFYYTLSGVLAMAFAGLLWAIFRHFITVLKAMELRLMDVEKKDVSQDEKIANHHESIKRIERMQTNSGADDIAEAIVSKLRAITPPQQGAGQWGHH